MNKMAVDKREAQLYDRQIRLWGVEAQKRMRESRILIINLTTVAVEICKNLVLSGYNVTLKDDDLVEEADIEQSFLFEKNDLNKEKAEVARAKLQELNTFVRVEICQTPIDGDNAEELDEHHIVCISGAELSVQIKLNEACRKRKIPFLSVDVFGYCGILFQDAIEHDYTLSTGSDKTLKVEQKHLSFPSLQESLAVSWAALKSPGRRGRHVSRVFVLVQALHKLFAEIDVKNGKESSSVPQHYLAVVHRCLKENGMPEDYIDDETAMLFLDHSRAEMPAVGAIVGGMCCQEINKIVTGRDEPIHNYFLYDGYERMGLVKSIAPGVAN